MRQPGIVIGVLLSGGALALADCLHTITRYEPIPCTPAPTLCNCDLSTHTCPSSCYTTGCQPNVIRGAVMGGEILGYAATYPCNTLSYRVGTCVGSGFCNSFILCPTGFTCPGPYGNSYACSGNPTYIVPCA